MQKYKLLKIKFITLLSVLFFLLNANSIEKPKLTVSFFILENIIFEIAKNEFTINVLISPKDDPHEFDLSPKQLIEIKKSDYFFYVNNNFEPWVDKLKPQLTHSQFGTQLLNSKNDSHFWLNQDLLLSVIDKIQLQLSKLNSSKKEIFEKNALQYKSKITLLFNKYKSTASLNINKKCYLVTPHGGYKYLAEFFNLNDYPLFSSTNETGGASGKNLISKITFLKKQTCVKLVNENSHLQNNFDIIIKELPFQKSTETLWGDEFENFQTTPTLLQIIEHNLKIISLI